MKNNEKKIKKAFEVACEREILGIDFKMNMQSLEHDLEEIKIKNLVKNEGRKDD